MVIHVHLYENGKFEDIEGDIKDCTSRWCQAKHDRDSMGNDVTALIAALREANEKIAQLESTVHYQRAKIVVEFDNVERLAQRHLTEIQFMRHRIRS